MLSKPVPEVSCAGEISVFAMVSICPHANTRLVTTESTTPMLVLIARP